MNTRYSAGLRVSEYLLEELLGRGTFGEVWRARHHVWEKERVAIKLPTEPEYVRYLQREGVVVHGIRHANVVRVLGLDPYAETPYLVMELVNGPSLRQVLDEAPKGLRLDTVVAIMRGLLTGIAAAHAADVVHRDLKPGNVMLNLDGRPVDAVAPDDVKVGDFGLGAPNADALRSMVMHSASLERTEQSSALAGTLVYMAPELREGNSAPTTQSDLYAVGAILFELLTGEKPAGAELPSTLRAEAPPWLDELFRKLYARADRRFRTAREVLDAIEENAAVRPGPPPPPGRAPHGPVDTLELGVDSGRMSCPSCRAAVEPEDQFCTQCGSQLVRVLKRCGACGGWPGPFDRFCIRCGAELAQGRR